MGLFISNVHIRKNDNFDMVKLNNELINMMESKGFRVADEGDEDTISVAICAPSKSKWVSVGSDFFDFANEVDTMAVTESLSKAFETDVLVMACFDSDYLFMNLVNVNDETDAWVNVKNDSAIKSIRRTVLGPWKNKVTDFEKFKNIVKEKRIFVEDVICECEPLFEMADGQSLFWGDSEDVVLVLKFAWPEGIAKELPSLNVWLANYMPCRMNDCNVVFAVNQGGKSRGIRVVFDGDFIENDDVVFEDVEFIYNKAGANGKVSFSEPVVLEKIKDKSDRTILYWENRNFLIPPRVSDDIPFGKKLDMESVRSFGVRFRPKGNKRKILDLKVYIIPFENYEDGMACWYAWNGHKDKSSYIEYLEENFSNAIENGYLNPADYDVL